MKNKIKTLVSLFLFIGIILNCSGSNPLDTSSKNRQRILKLEIGMSKELVIAIMGKSENEYISNPFKREMLKDKDGKVFEVLFYYTQRKKAEGNITDDELTPMVFDDNKLLGWGWGFVEETNIVYKIKFPK